jgi:hypothetical protein
MPGDEHLGGDLPSVKRLLGQMEFGEAKRPKELERENMEFKKMLAGILPKNRMPEAVREKVTSPEQYWRKGSMQGNWRFSK